MSDVCTMKINQVYKKGGIDAVVAIRTGNEYSGYSINIRAHRGAEYKWSWTENVTDVSVSYDYRKTQLHIPCLS